MRIQKIAAVSLAVCLFFSACERGPSPEEGETAARGRYVEQETNFPDFTWVAALDQVAPDTFYALGTRNQFQPPFEVVCSTDGGVTWHPREYEGITELQITSAAFTPQGGLYVGYVENSVDGADPQFAAAYLDGEGVFPFENPEQMDAFYFWLVTGYGEMLLCNGYEIAQVNLTTGQASRQYALEEHIIKTGALCTYDNTLAVSGTTEIALFHLDTGERLGSLPYVQADDFSRAIAVQPDRSGFYYCDRDGLYRVSMDGAITEQLIDGALTSFGMPSVYVERLYACADGSFVLLCSGDNRWQLQRYTYNPDAAREPEQELTLFMLREDAFVRQLIGLYHTANPDVMVSAYVGVSGENAVTPADAMRTLSAELLAGAGPDILVLDSLPFDSYRRQGALLDLTGALSDVTGGLLPNVAADFAGGEGIYAVPTRISVPVIAGAGIGNIHDLGGLARYVESREGIGIGVEAQALMDEFYPACAAGWFPPERGLDLSAVTADLAALQQLAALQEGKPDFLQEDLSTRIRAMYWNYNQLALVYAPLRQMLDVAPILSAVGERGEGEVRLFPDAVGGIYLPGSILGINAAGGNVDAAVEFVQLALSQKAQAISFGTGVAVTLEGLEMAAHSMQPGAMVLSVGSVDPDTDEMYEFSYYWPDDASMRQVMNLLQTARTPVLVDEAMREMVLMETEGLLSGGQTVEQTALSISRAVERYMQELD